MGGLYLSLEVGVSVNLNRRNLKYIPVDDVAFNAKANIKIRAIKSGVFIF